MIEFKQSGFARAKPTQVEAPATLLLVGDLLKCIRIRASRVSACEML